MSDLLSRELPAPKNWQDFERLTFDLYRRLWKCSDAELHGRVGQPQSGVDVYGTDTQSGRFVGVQCKGKESELDSALTESELRAEVQKALTFQPPLDEFIVATTAANDVAIQSVARSITADHAKIGRFSVQVKGWTTLRQLITDFPDLVVKHFGDFAPIDLAAAQIAAQDEARLGFDELLSLVRQQSNRIVSNVRDTRHAGDALADRATEVGKLVGEGSPGAAIRALKRLLADEGDDASPLALFRIYANLGNAEFSIGDDVSAMESFRLAYEAYPEYPNARAIMAMLHSIGGRKEVAFEMARDALAEDPESLRAAGVVIDCAVVETADEIEALIPDSQRGSGEILLRLSMRAHELGQADASLGYARKALAVEPNDWRMQAAVGEALVVPLSAMEGVALTNDLPAALRDAVAEAILVFERAWNTLNSRDSSHIGRHVAANLIGLLSLEGRSAEADKIAQQGAAKNPNYEPFVLRLAQRSASNGNWASVLNSMEAIEAAELRFESALLLVQAALHCGEAARARPVLSRLTELARLPAQAEIAAGFNALVEIELGASRDATTSKVISDFPDSVIVRSVFFDAWPEDEALREALTSEIASRASGELGAAAKVHAAETLFSAGSYSVAADIYAQLHSGADSYVLRKHLRALYFADRRKDARALFESLPRTVRMRHEYASIGAAIYERAGLLKPAINMMEAKLAEVETLGDRIGWLQLLARLGRTRQMAGWLRDVPEDVEGTPLELISIAQLIERYTGEPKALTIGYRALRAGYGDEQIHLAYAIGLIIGARDAKGAIVVPAEVGPGTGVIIASEDGNEIVFRMLETEPNPVIERGEIDPAGEYAKAIIGLRRGDRFSIPRLGAEPANYFIREIQDRTQFAVQRTLREFSTLFPTNQAFGSFDIDDAKGDEKYEPIFDMVRRRAEFGKQIESLYAQGLPFFTLAKFSGSSVFDLWEGFRNGPDRKVRVAVGGEAEFGTGQIAASGKICVVDPLSIFAWSRLGLLDTMLKNRSKLAVVQSTIDLLRLELDERLGQRGRRMGTIVWDGERYHSIELDEASIEESIRIVELAIEFAEGCELVPAESDIGIPEKLQEIMNDAHDAYADSLLASLQPHRALLTDDLSFRLISQEVGAQVCWTQTFLQANSASIAAAEYRDAVDALLISNYEFTQFGHLEIIGEQLADGWQTGPRLQRFAVSIADDVVSRESAAEVVSRLLLDSHPLTNSDAQFAGFARAYVSALTASGKTDTLTEEFERIFAAVERNAMKRLNRMHLRKRLLRTTMLTSTEIIAKAWAPAATRVAENLFARLKRGGETKLALA